MLTTALSCFLAILTMGAVTAPCPQEATTVQARVGAPYLLEVCAVSGEKLPGDGGVVLIMDGKTDARQKGREVRFCCTRCKSAFEKEPSKYVQKIDELVIADQLPRYPASVPCLVMTDEVMTDPTGPDAQDCKMVVWNNRLVRLCCARCVRKFNADPARYVAVLDEAVIRQAKKAGTVKNCVVNGRPLSTRANWFMIGDRAAATCCRGCQPKAMAKPREAIAKLQTTT